MSGSVPSPGWYPDAVDAAMIRWWDGSDWTDHTQAAPDAAPAATATATVDQVPAPVSAASAVKPEPFGVAPSTPDALPGATSTLNSSSTSAATSASGGIPAASPSSPGSRRDALSTSSMAFPISAPVRLPPPTQAPIPVPAPEPTVRLTPPVSRQQAAQRATSTSTLSTVATGSQAIPASNPQLTPAASAAWSAPSSFAVPGSAAAEMASVDYEPMVRTWGAPRNSASRPVTGWSTGGAWMLALSPLIALGLAALDWWLTDGGTSTQTTTIVVATGGGLLLWLLLGALADFRRLGALGHEYRPSVLWVVLGPFFYLLVRAVHVFRTCGRGVAPTWMFVVMSLLVAASLGALGLLQPRDATLAELRQVESSIASDLQEQGLDYNVICPDMTSASLGSSFVCTAYDEVGPRALIRVQWTGLGGAFEYAVD